MESAVTSRNRNLGKFRDIFAYIYVLYSSVSFVLSARTAWIEAESETDLILAL